MEIVFATGNANKAKEVGKILTGHKILSLQDIGFTAKIEEPYPTLSGNALHKAEEVYKIAQKPTFAEDTGLEVDALAGAPGVFTARYAGLSADSHSNMSLLLKNLQEVEDRNAQFRTVVAYIDGKGRRMCFEGIIRGRIHAFPCGVGGFGYDPIFIPDGHEKTFAQLPSELKNQISHRARAVFKLQAFLSSGLAS